MKNLNTFIKESLVTESFATVVSLAVLNSFGSEGKEVVNSLVEICKKSHIKFNKETKKDVDGPSIVLQSSGQDYGSLIEVLQEFANSKKDNPKVAELQNVIDIIINWEDEH